MRPALLALADRALATGDAGRAAAVAWLVADEFRETGIVSFEPGYLGETFGREAAHRIITGLYLLAADGLLEVDLLVRGGTVRLR